MEEERFRVSVCLQHYYDDRRSRAYISVIPKNKVHWLHQRLRTLFALEGGFFLRSRGHLLHQDEPLSLLRPDDPIEVIPLPEARLEINGDKSKLNGKDYSQSQRNLTPSRSEEIRELVEFEEMPTSQEDAGDEKLLQMKQQALELLDQFSEVNEPGVDEPEGAGAEGPRRRRRVRRRRRPPAPLGPLAPLAPLPAAPLGPRTPRLVRSLSPS